MNLQYSTFVELGKNKNLVNKITWYGWQAPIPGVRNISAVPHYQRPVLWDELICMIKITYLWSSYTCRMKVHI